MKEDAPRVIKIPAKPEATRQAEARRQLRVAAYCRVSTKEEDQANSYEVQKEYYTDKIMSNTAWTMAGIFADEAVIIGLKTLRLIKCQKHGAFEPFHIKSANRT